MTSSTSDEIVFLVFDAGNREIGYLTKWKEEDWFGGEVYYDFWIYSPDLPTDLLQAGGVYLKDVQALFRVSPK